jgi:hypothetical protein
LIPSSSLLYRFFIASLGLKTVLLAAMGPGDEGDILRFPVRQKGAT